VIESQNWPAVQVERRALTALKPYKKSGSVERRPLNCSSGRKIQSEIGRRSWSPTPRPEVVKKAFQAAAKEAKIWLPYRGR